MTREGTRLEKHSSLPERPADGCPNQLINCVFSDGLEIPNCLVAALNLIVASWIQDKKHFGFVLWLSYLNCLLFPVGTVNGAWSLSTLRTPANIAAFMRPELSADELHATLARSALVEIILIVDDLELKGIADVEGVGTWQSIC